VKDGKIHRVNPRLHLFVERIHVGGSRRHIGSLQSGELYIRATTATYDAEQDMFGVAPASGRVVRLAVGPQVVG